MKHFKFSDGLLYKLIDSERAVRVSIDYSIDITLASATSGLDECTQSEFDEAYDRTVKYLNELTYKK